MLLELKRGGRKGVGEGQRRVLAKTNVRGGPRQNIGGRVSHRLPSLYPRMRVVMF